MYYGKIWIIIWLKLDLIENKSRFTILFFFFFFEDKSPVLFFLEVLQYTVCKFKKFPPGNLFFLRTVEKFPILEYSKVAILPQGPVTTLV